MARQPKRGDRGSGAGTFFVGVGCLAVLGVTFMLGVLAGHAWPSFSFLRSQTTTKAPRERETRVPEAPPTLTFYHELTAPLTAPPPPKPAKPARPEAPKPEPPKVEAPQGAPASAASTLRYTVQVGAYKTREPAEALRARLAAGGHDAYIVETDGSAAARFRVRVGAFATREAAQDAAARIVADRALSAFVTAR